MRNRTSEKTVSLHIKNMVCDRCIRVVREELEALGLRTKEVKLGEAVVVQDTKPVSMDLIRSVLERNGFGLLDSRRARIVAKIKAAVLNLVRSEPHETGTKIKDSEFIANEVGLDYSYLSTLFSTMEHVTIEKYIILQKIERVKELIKYDELSLKEIAYTMGYSSLAHLSNQFKKVTGMSPTQFKKLKDPPRFPLDSL